MIIYNFYTSRNLSDEYPAREQRLVKKNYLNNLFLGPTKQKSYI